MRPVIRFLAKTSISSIPRPNYSITKFRTQSLSTCVQHLDHSSFFQQRLYRRMGQVLCKPSRSDTVSGTGSQPSQPVSRNESVARRNTMSMTEAVSKIAMYIQRTPSDPLDIKFRVLIIGRANAGKTSILQRVCDTTDSPQIFSVDSSGVRTLVRSRSLWKFPSHHLTRFHNSMLRWRYARLIFLSAARL
jgi:hypothetical protein